MNQQHIDLIVAAVERRVGGLPGTARKKCRKNETVRVKKIVFYVLNRAGMSPAQLGRNFSIDASSVINLLEKAEREMDSGTAPWWQETRHIATRVLSGGKRVLFNFRLERAITGLSKTDQRAVVLYANGPLLGWERNDPQVEAYGLTVITRDIRARYALEQALIVAELQDHIPRVDMQAKSLERRGYVNARS